MLVVVRFAAVTIEWRKADEIYAPYLRAFEAIPDGSRVFFAFGHAGSKQISTRPIYHLPTLVLAERDVYVPYLFASNSGGFTLQYQPEAGLEIATFFQETSSSSPAAFTVSPPL